LTAVALDILRAQRGLSTIQPSNQASPAPAMRRVSRIASSRRRQAGPGTLSRPVRRKKRQGSYRDGPLANATGSSQGKRRAICIGRGAWGMQSRRAAGKSADRGGRRSPPTPNDRAPCVPSSGRPGQRCSNCTPFAALRPKVGCSWGAWRHLLRQRPQAARRAKLKDRTRPCPGSKHARLTSFFHGVARASEQDRWHPADPEPLCGWRSNLHHRRQECSAGLDLRTQISEVARQRCRLLNSPVTSTSWPAAEEGGSRFWSGSSLPSRGSQWANIAHRPANACV